MTCRLKTKKKHQKQNSFLAMIIKTCKSHSCGEWITHFKILKQNNFKTKRMLNKKNAQKLKYNLKWSIIQNNKTKNILKFSNIT